VNWKFWQKPKPTPTHICGVCGKEIWAFALHKDCHEGPWIPKLPEEDFEVREDRDGTYSRIYGVVGQQHMAYFRNGQWEHRHVYGTIMWDTSNNSNNLLRNIFG